VRKYVDQDGRRRCPGGPALKGTQTYPPEFGVAVARVYNPHKADVAAAACCSTCDFCHDTLWSAADNLWNDANLDPVIDFLHGMIG